VIVVEASALLEFLLQTQLGTRVQARLYRAEEELHAPHLLDVEISQALRRLVRLGEISADRANEVIEDLMSLDLHRHPHLELLTRAWALRGNITSYDAMYVVLAEALDVPLITCDAPLARVRGHQATVELIA
jgi:predicted nucleic acid-binding protein